MKIRLNWSGRSHDYSYKEKNYLLKVLDSDNLTQGKEKDLFEQSLKNYLKIENVFLESPIRFCTKNIGDPSSIKISNATKSKTGIITDSPIMHIRFLRAIMIIMYELKY